MTPAKTAERRSRAPTTPEIRDESPRRSLVVTAAVLGGVVVLSLLATAIGVVLVSYRPYRGC